MPKAGGKKGLVVSTRPGEYEMTDQQKMFKEVLKRCDIKKGMKKEDLMKQMKECVPEEWAKITEEKEKGKPDTPPTTAPPTFSG